MSDEEIVQGINRRISAFDIRSLGAYPEPDSKIDHKRAAVLLPISVRNGEIFILLTKRSKHLRAHPGTVAFPGGMRDDVDPSDVETALREAEEEIGLPSSSVKVLGILTLGVTLPKNVVYPVVGLIPADFQAKCNPSEVDYAFFVPLHLFFGDDNVTYSSFNLKGRPMEYPTLYYTHGGVKDRIFGFTCNYCIYLAKILYEPEDVENNDLILSAKQMRIGLEHYFEWLLSDLQPRL